MDILINPLTTVIFVITNIDIDHFILHLINFHRYTGDIFPVSDDPVVPLMVQLDVQFLYLTCHMSECSREGYTFFFQDQTTPGTSVTPSLFSLTGTGSMLELGKRVFVSFEVVGSILLLYSCSATGLTGPEI